MRSIDLMAALTAGLLLWCAAPLAGAAAIQSARREARSAGDSPVACSLVTTDQISAAIGGTAGAGSPISAPTSCQWAGPQNKRVTLTISQPRNNQSPVDQFNDAKTRPFPGVTREPVAGTGDDAFYVYFTGQNRMGCGLTVKKGTGVFEVRVYGFDLDQAKVVSKAIAQNAAAKF